MEDGEASAGGINSGQFPQRQQLSAGIAQQQGADGFRVAPARFVENDGDIGGLISAVGLGHHRALVGSLDRLQDLRRPKAEGRQLLRAEAHHHPRGARRRFHQDIPVAGDAAQHMSDLARLDIQQVKVFPEDVDHDGLCLAGDGFADPVPEKR